MKILDRRVSKAPVVENTSLYRTEKEHKTLGKKAQQRLFFPQTYFFVLAKYFTCFSINCNIHNRLSKFYNCTLLGDEQKPVLLYINN